MDTTGTWQDYFPLSSLSNRITFCRHNTSDGAPPKHSLKGSLLVSSLPRPLCLHWRCIIDLTVFPGYIATMLALSYDFAFMHGMYNLKWTNFLKVQSFCCLILNEFILWSERIDSHFLSIRPLLSAQNPHYVTESSVNLFANSTIKQPRNLSPQKRCPKLHSYITTKTMIVAGPRATL